MSKALGQGLENAGHTVFISPLADGGDGTLDAFDSLGYLRESAQVRGSNGEIIEAQYALKDDTAVIEIARACGLDLASPEGTTPTSEFARNAGSWGVGDLILAALDQGARRIIIGLGGSVTTDAGCGMAQALGVEFLRADGSEITDIKDMGSVHDIRGDQVDPRISHTEFIVASDVRNPLCGPDGAAMIYGPQKGLNTQDVAEVDQMIYHFSQVVQQALGKDNVSTTPGAGAAGGLGFMAIALLAAEMQSGVDMILNETGGDAMLDRADLVITGEGRIDEQTLSGKAPAGIAQRARSRNIPVVAVCGQNQLDSDSAGQLFEAIYSLADFEADISECIRHPLPILTRIGAEIARRHLLTE
nr:glycerate kinase [Corynebacterium deserti]